MSTHIRVNFECPCCGENFLPFDDSQRLCPKCGNVASEVIVPIAKIVSAAKENIAFGVFSILSLADMYIDNAIDIILFAGYPQRTSISQEEAELICHEVISGRDFSNSEHQRAHATAFVMAVLKEAFLKKA